MSSALAITERSASGGRSGLSWVPVPAAGAACFHLVQTGMGPGWLFVGFLAAWASARLTPSARWCFYGTLVLGLASYTPHLRFLWTIFGPAAVPLWMILPLWLAASALLLRAVGHRFGSAAAAWAAPFVWTGTEFLRSEVWWLRFSWLGSGGVSGFLVDPWGVYGSGFVLALAAASVVRLLESRRAVSAGNEPAPAPGRFRLLAAPQAPLLAAWIAVVAGTVGVRLRPGPVPTTTSVAVAGLQLEFPSDTELARGLDALVRDHPDTRLVVLPEYTFEGPPPPWIRDWCRSRSRWLIVGGKEWISDATPASSEGTRSLQTASMSAMEGMQAFRNTAFVVSTNGEVVFRQAKSRPIQFFKDGLPATEQRLWESPWGPLGIAICYDASYRQVTDRLVRLGARALVFPTMDVEEWGPEEHHLNARQAALRALEYRIPVLRVASSGPSTFHDSGGRSVATTPVGNNGAVLLARLEPSAAPGSVPVDALLAPVCLAAAGLLALVSVPRRFRIPGIAHSVTPPSPAPSER